MEKQTPNIDSFFLLIPPTLNSLAPGSEHQGAEKTDLWPVAEMIVS